MLNLKSKNTHYVSDEYGMMVVKGDSESWKDSIGRTVLCWIAYDTPEELEYALDGCWRGGKLYRHPAHDELASRDHHSYNIISMNMFLKQSQAYKNYVEKLPSMRGMNLWMKSLTGNKRAEWWYYFWAIPGAYIGNGFLRFCRWAGRIGTESRNDVWIEYGTAFLSVRTPWQRIWAWIIFQTMPAYALHVKAWQIYVMPKAPKRDALRKIFMKRVGKSNIMLRLLLGDKLVEIDQIRNYPHMTGYRPGVYLDETCRRDIREMDGVESEWNTYEKDLIHWLYENRNQR